MQGADPPAASSGASCGASDLEGRAPGGAAEADARRRCRFRGLLRRLLNGQAPQERLVLLFGTRRQLVDKSRKTCYYAIRMNDFSQIGRPVTSAALRARAELYAIQAQRSEREEWAKNLLGPGGPRNPLKTQIQGKRSGLARVGWIWLNLDRAWTIALFISPGADGAIGAGLASTGPCCTVDATRAFMPFGFLSAHGLIAAATRQGAARLACSAINPATTPGFSTFGR